MTNTALHNSSLPFSDKARADILRECLQLVPFEGWSQKVLVEAVSNVGLPKGADGLYFPGGPLEVIQFWADECDRSVEQALSELDLTSMKIRDKVTQAVILRMEAISEHETAAKRAMSRLLLPDAVGQGPKQLWASADMIWRAIGDTSTDMNFYSKRTILSGVLGSTLVSWLGDVSIDKAEARAFLDARIGNVMQFEKAKWTLKKRAENLPNPAEILGRLRYGTRTSRRRRRY